MLSQMFLAIIIVLTTVIVLLVGLLLYTVEASRRERERLCDRIQSGNLQEFKALTQAPVKQSPSLSVEADSWDEDSTEDRSAYLQRSIILNEANMANAQFATTQLLKGD